MGTIKKKYLIFDKTGKIKETDKLGFVKIKIKKKGDWIKDISIMNVGYYIITPIILGVFCGILIDNYFNTKPMFFLILLLFGTIGGFYNLFRLIKN